VTTYCESIRRENVWWCTSVTPALGRLRQEEFEARAECQWLTAIILATWEAEIKRITVGGQTQQKVHETLISKITRAKWAEVWLKR
jgi:hypothetical protein